MATTIRLARQGGHKRPYYRIVVTDSRNARNGRFIEDLGYYDPLAPQARVKVDIERLKSWLDKGAKASQTVGQIFRKATAAS